MAASGGPPHINFVELIPGKEGFDQALEHFLGQPYYGEGFLDSSPIIYGVGVFTFLIAFSLLGGFLRKRAEERVIPEERLTPRTVMELLVEAILGLMTEIMGEREARRFLPLIGTLALFIFFSNLMGLIPGFLPPTGSINTTIACAIPVFVATHYFGIKEHGIAYYKHFFGPVIKWYALPLMLLMFAIETISHLARPLSLSVRLFGNIMADHMVISIFLALVPLVVPIPVMLLGVLVAVVQTLVFSILAMVYISMAVGHQEESH